MTPVSLNEFLIRYPAILRLRLQVDEAAVELKHAHVASLRALADKNTPLIRRWGEYFRECNRGHLIFVAAFYREMTGLFTSGSGPSRPINKKMLKRKAELDECMFAIENAEEVCDRSFHEKNTRLFVSWQEHFDKCRRQYLSLLRAFRREFLKSQKA